MNLTPKVVIGFACSGVMRRAFNDAGLWAMEIDLQPTDDPQGAARAAADRMGGHWQGDVFDVLEMLEGEGIVPDLFIAHPDCTYLSVSGLHWNKRNPERASKTAAALDMVARVWALPFKRLAIENPQGCINTRLPFMPRPQYIQPNQFGDDASKKTGLWLRDLPPLVADPAQYVAPRLVCDQCGCTTRLSVAPPYNDVPCPSCATCALKPRWSNQKDDGQNCIPERKGRAKERSRTYPGIAKAIAEQWGKLLC